MGAARSTLFQTDERGITGPIGLLTLAQNDLVQVDIAGEARASRSRLAGPKRFQPVPVPLHAMPPLDLVVVSHDHDDHLDYPTIRERLGPFDLVMLEVGAFHPAWGDIHLGPENALKALALLGGGPFLPAHWSTFNLAPHAWDQPAETLLQLGPAAGAQLLMPRLGEAVEPAHGERIEPWWRVVDADAHAPTPDTAQPDDPAEGDALADRLRPTCSSPSLAPPENASGRPDYIKIAFKSTLYSIICF